MQKKKIMLSLISLILCALFVFGACSSDSKKENNEKDNETVTSDFVDADGQDATEDVGGENSELPPKTPSTEKLIALTYDDGPNPSTTNRILTTLEENNSVATFFIVGNRIDSGHDTIERAVDMGCEIANHTYDHKYLNEISDSERNNQINSVNSKMKNDFGFEVKLLRAPGGKYKGVTDSIDMPLIQWSIDTNDWRHKDVSSKPRTEEQRQKEMDEIIDHVMDNVKSGDIILMHDIYDFTADMSEILIPKLVAAGYKLVTVSEMYEAYAQDLEGGEVYFNAYFKPAVHTVEPIPAGDYYVKTENGGGLNLREDATTSSAILAEIPDSTALKVTEAVKGWAKVSYNGKTGWVSTAYLRSDSVG